MKRTICSVPGYLIFLLFLTSASKAQDLSNLSPDDRQSIEIACVFAKSDGPATYHNCLNKQLLALGGGQAPSLSGLSPDDRQSIEIACVFAKSDGPATYHNCLSKQLQALGGLKAPTLSDLSPDDRQSIEIACVFAKSDGPATYHNCLAAQLHALAVFQTLSTSRVRGGLSGTSGTENESANTDAPHLPGNPPCAENGSCFGEISKITGFPKTILVHGYTRSDGTYVRGYFRSK